MRTQWIVLFAACCLGFLLLPYQSGCSATTAECVVDGKTWQVGQSFPANDGCNTCSCGKNGTVSCTEKACESKACGGDAGVVCASATEYCDYTVGSCGADKDKGVCKARPSACDANVDPVCGCDNKTYSNACVAASNGVSVKAKGKCS